MNPSVKDYIESAPDIQKAAMKMIRDIIFDTVPNVTESIKWGQPVFTATTDFAYFKSNKAHLNFGIYNIQKIKHYTEMLEGTGKSLRHYKIRQMEDVKPEVIRQWVLDLTYP